MESKIALALAVKLRKLFKEPDRPEMFLSFPIGLGFTYEELDFMNDESSLPAEKVTVQTTLRNQFARLLGLIPEDRVKFDGSGSHLWDGYRNILEMANLAESDLNEEEKNKLTEAEDFLTDIDKLPDGTEVPVYSNAYKQYLYYQTLAYSAEKDYIDEKETVENSSDEKLKKDWEDFRKEELLRSKQKAEDDWQLLGFRDKVKASLETKSRYSQRPPLCTFRNTGMTSISALFPIWKATDCWCIRHFTVRGIFSIDSRNGTRCTCINRRSMRWPKARHRN